LESHLVSPDDVKIANGLGGVSWPETHHFMLPIARCMSTIRNYRLQLRQIDAPDKPNREEAARHGRSQFTSIFNNWYAGRSYHTDVELGAEASLSNRKAQNYDIKIRPSWYYFKKRLDTLNASPIVDSRLIYDALRHSMDENYVTWKVKALRQSMKRGQDDHWKLISDDGYVTCSVADGAVMAFSDTPEKSLRLCRSRIIRSIDKKIMGGG
jgi:hypothetical protein